MIGVDEEAKPSALEPRGNTTVMYQGSKGLTYEEAQRELQAQLTLGKMQEEIVQTAGRTAEAAGKLRVVRTETLVKVKRAEKALGDIETELTIAERVRPLKIQTAVLRAETEFAKAKTANYHAEVGRERAFVSSRTELAAEQSRHLETLGPTNEERSRAEAEREIAAWAHSVAEDAARWVYKLRREAPFSEEQGYYAYAGVHYYAARVQGASHADAISTAAEKLAYRKKIHGRLAGDEPKDFADKCQAAFDAWKRKEKADELERQRTEEAVLRLELARSGVEEARHRNEAAERLEHVIQGRKNDVQFDPSA